MPDLDAPETWPALDARDMLSRIADLPDQCEDAWKGVQQLALPDEYREAVQVVILGMGGSAIGGELLRTLLANECPVPIVVHRDYVLPAYVGRRTLVIACSYSGDTEETLISFDSALHRGARLVSIATGGELARRTREHGVPMYFYQYRSQPRAALGYVFMALLGIMQRLGFSSDKSADVTEALSVTRRWQEEIKGSVPTAENAAKQLAHKLQHKLPVVYGAEHLSEVARRWKGQFNENAKSWAAFDVLPELNHNSVAGYAFPTGLSRFVYVIMLSSSLNHARVRLRFDITRELLHKRGLVCETIEARGRSALAQMLSTVHFGDFVSYYLAMLNDVDPWAIGSIQFVKDRLGEA